MRCIIHEWQLQTGSDRPVTGRKDCLSNGKRKRESQSDRVPRMMPFTINQQRAPIVAEHHRTKTEPSSNCMKQANDPAAAMPEDPQRTALVEGGLAMAALERCMHATCWNVGWESKLQVDVIACGSLCEQAGLCMSQQLHQCRAVTPDWQRTLCR